MKGDGHLGQSLKELLFCRRRFAPNIFQDFVRGEELGVIEELNAPRQAVPAHAVLTQERIVAGRTHKKQQRN